MAYLTLNKEKLNDNFEKLRELFSQRNISWGIVTKLLCGNRLYLQELLNLGVNEIHDSRVSNLRIVKNIQHNAQTVYIKPPAKRSIASVVRWADVSLNTEYRTIKWLSEEAVKQGKVHKIIIMIETGDLREGVMGEALIDFYDSVFELPSIEIIGLGTNLNCLSGVMPSADKLIQLSLYKQIIELKFNKKIPWVSAGTSVTIPLLLNHQLPEGINHFRVGETLYFGADLFTESTIPGMHDDVFTLFAEIIEMHEKPLVPTGNLAANPQGDVIDIDPGLFGKTSCRAIIDIGLLDVDPKYLLPVDNDLEVLGASSDMVVIDLHDNPKKYQVGQLLQFQLKYMGLLALMNSNYIEKRLKES
jgi:predicted amino acid racemase